MELWIRNQDKVGLYKVDEIYLDERDYGNNDITYYIKTEGALLGRYSTEERALEILDEIQNIIKPKIFIQKGKIEGMIENQIIRDADKPQIIEMSTYVYEMPKE